MIKGDITVAEQQQAIKQQAKTRYYNRKMDKRRVDGEQRIKPIIKRGDMLPDEDLIGIDLRRITRLSDLPSE